MLRFCTYDVFTGQRYAGNPLAIVEGADSLTTDQMQTIAREFNLSETIFVMAPRDAKHDAKVRIFFPTAEIPFAGHPTLGCAVFLASRKYGDGDFTGQIVLEEEAGIVPVDLTRSGGAVEGWFSAPVLPERIDLALAPAKIAGALGLDPGQIGWRGQVPGLWEGGPRFLFVPVADRAALAAARPLEPQWSALTEACGTGGVYLYTDGDMTDIQARMLAPTDGIPEDPATGSATAILSGQLHAHGGLGEGETGLTLLQGAEMGRPSDLGLRVTVEAGALTKVRVGGTAVPVMEGHLTPPD